MFGSIPDAGKPEGGLSDVTEWLAGMMLGIWDSGTEDTVTARPFRNFIFAPLHSLLDVCVYCPTINNGTIRRKR